MAPDPYSVTIEGDPLASSLTARAGSPLEAAQIAQSWAQPGERIQVLDLAGQRHTYRATRLGLVSE